MAQKTFYQFDLKTLILLTLFAGGALGLFMLMPPRSKPRPIATRALLKSLETACAAYEFEWHAFPPDQSPSGKKSSAALLYYLTTTFRKTPTKAGEVWSTMDAGPYLDLNARFLKVDATGTPIIVDIWGQPIEYDNIREDNSTPDGFTSCGPDDIRTDGKPRNVKSFDLFSRGLPGANAPITNFEDKRQ